jgi:hypothetical protein
MKRRQFITVLGGAAAWPIAARAQDRWVRRIGVLMLYPEGDPEGQLRPTAFRQGLEKLGWAAGRNRGFIHSRHLGMVLSYRRHSLLTTARRRGNKALPYFRRFLSFDHTGY